MGELLEEFEKIFLRLCEKFTKMWRYLEDLFELDTEQIFLTIFKMLKFARKI